MKNNEKLNEAIGNIDNKMIEAAYNRQTDKKDRSGLFQIISSAAAVIAVAVFAVFLSQFAKKDDNIAGSSETDKSKTTIEIKDDDYGSFICGTQKVKGLLGLVYTTQYDDNTGGWIEGDGLGLSFELKEMTDPPTIYYKSGDKIEYIIDPENKFKGLQLWDQSGEYTISYGDDLYAYLDANLGEYYLAAEQFSYGRAIGDERETSCISMAVKIVVESETTQTTPEHDSITKRFIELIAQNGRLTNGTVKEFNIENAESIKNVTPDDFKDQLPGVYIFDVDNHKFIMTDGVIYEPFTTFGGTVFAAIPCDYNKDGVKDIVALTTWGSGLGYESVETFDMKTKQFRSIYVKNVLFEDMFEFECKNDEIYINGTKVNITDNGILPSDFRFSFTWNTFGISSYDSATGTLVKTRDATDVSKYTAVFKMTDKELIKVYSLLSNLINYPDTYDPYNDPNSDTKMMSTPNRTVIISFTAFGYEKTITCNNICFGTNGGYDNAAQTFLQIEKQMEDILTSTNAWQSLPDYEFLYD